MTNPVPGPRQPYGPAGGTPTSGSPTPSAPSGTYPPQGSPASYPAPTGVPVPAARAGGPVSYAAPTGEGWSGRSLSSSEKNTQEALLALKAEIGKAVIGQDAAVTGLIVGLVAGGHALLEGVPGVAKTLLVRTLARALDVNMARIQFTPDLMPGDVTGSLIYDSRSAQFSFRAGPVFTNLLLADEINRTPPKTQSALLEAMEERQVSIDGEPRALPDPFMVIATQNPVEYEGTYPLPEAQLDRFLLKLVLPLPERAQEIEVLSRHTSGFDPRDLLSAGLRAVAGVQELAQARAQVSTVGVTPEVLAYAVDLVRATRSMPSVALGVSPRGATALLAASRAWAWLAGRSFVTPDDIKALALPALRHRIKLHAEAEMEGITPQSVIEAVLRTVPVPR